MPDYANPHAETARLLNEQATAVLEFRRLAVSRAHAKARYKKEAAKRRLRARAEGAKSIAEADAITEADDGIADLYLAHLESEALADAQIEHIRELRQDAEFGRSLIADARTADNLHARGYSGAA